MGLYLAIFDEDDELDGVEVGAYADFSIFRDAVVVNLEGGRAGSRFPILGLHSDCDGEWSPNEAAALEVELQTIVREFAVLPPIPLGGWKADVAKMLGLNPTNLGDCFFDVDGEPLLERLIGLARLAQNRRLPIIFQ